MHIQVLYGEREVDRKIISQKKKKEATFLNMLIQLMQ